MSESQSTDMTTDQNLSCTLSPKELEAQRNELIPGLFLSAETVEDIADGIRFTFKHEKQLITRLAVLIEKERVCCSFLSFKLSTEPGLGHVTLEVNGPTGTAEMLRKL